MLLYKKHPGADIYTSYLPRFQNYFLEVNYIINTVVSKWTCSGQ